MKKYRFLMVIASIAVTLLAGCKDDAYYGSELPGGVKTTVGFSGSDETIVTINSFDGIPKVEESTITIPVKLYAPLTEDVTVKLTQNDAMLDRYYKGSRFGLVAFPEGVLKPGSATIPAGKTEGFVEISLQDASKMDCNGEYLAAIELSVQNKDDGNVQVFGVQYHFIKALQKRSDNEASLSIGQKEIILTANNPQGEKVLDEEAVRLTVNTTIAQERKVTLLLQNNPSLLKYFYKKDAEGFSPFPEGVLNDVMVEIPEGETSVDVVIPFAHAEKLIDEPGYLTAFRLKELSEDRKYVSASDDSYFFVKVKQTTSVILADRYVWGDPLEKLNINAYANGTDQKLPALLDGNTKGDFFEIANSEEGSLELKFKFSEKVRDLTLHTNAEESGITSFYVAVTKDKGKTWLPRGLVKVNETGNEFNISFQPNPRIYGIKIYGLKGTGSGLKVYEATPYVTFW